MNFSSSAGSLPLERSDDDRATAAVTTSDVSLLISMVLSLAGWLPLERSDDDRVTVGVTTSDVLRLVSMVLRTVPASGTFDGDFDGQRRVRCEVNSEFDGQERVRWKARLRV